MATRPAFPIRKSPADIVRDAAHDLLAALDDILNGENWRAGRKFDPNSGNFDLSTQRAAIAKARGQV